MNSSLCDAATSESGQFDSRSKQMDVGFSADPAIASWIRSYFDNVMTKFMINNRTDA